MAMTNFIILSTLNGINDLSIPCESILSIKDETDDKKTEVRTIDGYYYVKDSALEITKRINQIVYGK